jgi:hypothetical protein
MAGQASAGRRIDSAQAPDSRSPAVSLRLTVAAVASEADFGRFGLQANHLAPLNGEGDAFQGRYFGIAGVVGLDNSICNNGSLHRS